MSEWKECKLSDLYESANTGLDAIKRAPIVAYDTGIRCLRIQDISQKKPFNQWGFCTVEKRNYEKFCLKPDDLLIARTGATIGANTIINTELKSVYNNGLIRLRLKKEICDCKFIYYHFQSYNYQGHIDAISGGTSTQPNMQISAFLDYELLYPPLLEQQAIAEVLSSLDDKIDLLTRQNKTLEDLAQAYFRQWFVEGNENDNVMVSDLAVLDNVSVNPSRKPLETFYHFSIPSFDDGHTPIIELGQSILSNKYVVQPNTILISKLNPIKPRIWRIGESVKPNSVCSTEFQVLKPFNMKHYLFLYCLMKSYDVVESFAMSASGTSGSHQRIRPEYITEVETPAPDEALLEKFNAIFTPIMQKVDKNEAEILTLQKLRDTLLPKLISGEVRVKM